MRYVYGQPCRQVLIQKKFHRLTSEKNLQSATSTDWRFFAILITSQTDIY